MDRRTLDAQLTFNQYQQRAMIFAQYPRLGAGINPVYPALGLAGEAGEVAEKIKKLWRNKGLVLDEGDRDDIAREMGDVLWYLAALGAELGIRLGEAAEGNLAKLSDRQERGVIKSEGDNR